MNRKRESRGKTSNRSQGDTQADSTIIKIEETAMSDFDVFLSHNSNDKPSVRKLKTKLEDQYDLKCWLDEEELPPGVPWQPLLEKGIRASRSVAVLIGNDGEGPWQAEETMASLELAVREKLPVIPVLLPSAPKRPELPMFLSNRGWVDLRGGLKKEDVERLAWGITGTKPKPTSSSQASPNGDAERSSAQSWRKAEFSPHVNIPPAQWRILDLGLYVLKTPQQGLGGFYNGLFHNSAGVAYDPQPGVIWTVEEYAEKKELYAKLERDFCPGLIAGSPANESYLIATRTKAALGDAKVFSDLLAGRGVKRNGDAQQRRAYSSIVIAMEEIGGDRNEALLKMRARVCRFHDLDISDVSDLPLHEFAELLETCKEQS